MPRKPRIVYPGFYHVVNRGVERRRTFLEEGDFDTFLQLLGKISREYQIQVHAYCLMSNHYHLLLETSQENISDAMKKLNGDYAAAFNKNHGRSGHLWQGRYKSWYLYDDSHFWTVAKYIERNPLAAGMVRELTEYPWQSIHARNFRTTHYPLLEGSKIHEMQMKEYLEFVQTDWSEAYERLVYTQPKIVTGENGQIQILKKRIENFFRYDEELQRNEAILEAWDYGYTKAEIARAVGLSPVAVGKIVNTYRESLQDRR